MACLADATLTFPSLELEGLTSNSASVRNLTLLFANRLERRIRRNIDGFPGFGRILNDLRELSNLGVSTTERVIKTE